MSCFSHCIRIIMILSRVASRILLGGDLKNPIIFVYIHFVTVVRVGKISWGGSTRVPPPRYNLAFNPVVSLYLTIIKKSAIYFVFILRLWGGQKGVVPPLISKKYMGLKRKCLRKQPRIGFFYSVVSA